MATLLETATASTTSTTATSVSVTLSTSPTAGEKLIAVIGHTDDFPDTPAGWTLDKETISSGVIRLFSKTAAGTEGTSLLFTSPSAGGISARVMRYSALGAIDSTAGGATSSAGTFNTGALTTTQSNVFLIAAGHLHAGTLPTDDVAPSSGFSKIASDIKSTNTGNKSQLHVSTGTAGAAGAYDFTGTYTPSIATAAESVLVGYAQISGDASVTAVRGTASAVLRAPLVSGTGSSSVTAVMASATAAFQVPSIDVITGATGGGSMVGSGVLRIPTVSGVTAGSAAVLPPRAIGSGQLPPSITGGQLSAYDRINDLWAVAVETVPGTYDVVNDIWGASGFVGTADEILDLWATVPGAPNVDAGPDVTFEPNVAAKLNLALSTTPESVTWTQLGGSAVALIGSGFNRAYLTPALIDGTTLTFQVSVVPSGGGSPVTDTVVHTIYPQQIWQLSSSRVKVPVFYGRTPPVIPDPDTTPNVTTDVLAEPFTGTSIDTRVWTASAGVTQNNTLTIPCTNTYPAISSLASHPSAGLSTYVQVLQTAGPGSGTCETLFMWEVDGSNNLRMERVGNSLAYGYRAAGTDSMTYVTWEPSFSKWWRIVEEGGVVSFQCSSTGAVWTTLGSVATPAWATNVVVSLKAGYYGAETSPGPAIFDNLNVPPVMPATTPGTINTGVWVPNPLANTTTWQANLDTFETNSGRRPNLVHFYHGWSGTPAFPSSVCDIIVGRGQTPMVTWEPWVPAGGTAQTTYKLSNIIAGNFDSFITSWALGAKAWGRPLYLRFAHEMNGNWYPWCESVNGNSAGQYASAWRHVKDIFTANAVTNVTWIWCPNIVYVGATALSGLYPGSSYVDMTGLDGYSSTAVPMTWDHRFAESIDTVRALDSTHPLWVDETGAVESGVNKPAWIADMFTTLKYRPEVTGLLWFNDIDPPNDYRIESTTASAVAYRSGIADARYLSAVNPGYGAGGYGVNPYGY